MTARQAFLPHEHVAAEVAALPLASEAAFRAAVTTLDPWVGGRTRELWRGAETALAAALPAFSLDELTLIRDDVWFRRGAVPVPLHVYLRTLANDRLVCAGDTAMPSRRSASADDPSAASKARWEWRWLTYALPGDLLAAALPTLPAAVSAVPSRLATQLVDRGFAEIHLHLGAALSFAHLWAWLQHPSALPTLRPAAMHSPGAAFSEGRGFVVQLVHASIGRIVLGRYLSRRDGKFRSLDDFLVATTRDRIRAWGSGVCGVLMSILGALRRPASSTGELKTLRTSHAEAVAVYRLVAGSRPASMPSTVDQLWRCDPLYRELPPAPGSQLGPEAVFVHTALDYLDRCPGDLLFAELFWQCVRVRCLLYRYLVQRPMTPGLQWFVRFYDRLEKITASSPGIFLAGPRATSGEGAGLRSLEVRFAPKAEVAGLVTKLIAIEDAVNTLHADAGAAGPTARLTPPEVGIVLHLPSATFPLNRRVFAFHWGQGVFHLGG